MGYTVYMCKEPKDGVQMAAIRIHAGLEEIVIDNSCIVLYFFLSSKTFNMCKCRGLDGVQIFRAGYMSSNETVLWLLGTMDA